MPNELWKIAGNQLRSIDPDKLAAVVEETPAVIIHGDAASQLLARINPLRLGEIEWFAGVTDVPACYRPKRTTSRHVANWPP